jgi:hypothetical protein
MPASHDAQPGTAEDGQQARQLTKDDGKDENAGHDGELRGLDHHGPTRIQALFPPISTPINITATRPPIPARYMGQAGPADPFVVEQTGGEEERQTHEHPADLVTPFEGKLGLVLVRGGVENGIHAKDDETGDVQNEQPVHAEEFFEERSHGGGLMTNAEVRSQRLEVRSPLHGSAR